MPNAHTERQQRLFDLLKPYIGSELPPHEVLTAELLWRDIRTLNAAELVETLAVVAETEAMIRRLERPLRRR